MVKIIQQGYQRLTCSKCVSVLEYTQSDVKSGEFNRDYLGDYDIYKYIDCPSCGNKCIIKD